jgi:adenylylsulfate kinase
MNNVFKQHFSVGRIEQNQLKGHKSMLLWFTGLSGSGKSTIANETLTALYTKGIHAYVLDGDNLRIGLNNDLGFSAKDRTENLRRIAEVSKIMIDAGILTIAAFVSPLKENREQIKSIVGEDNFIEIFVNTSLEVCERRDTKGLYAKARSGEVKDFTGISAPYEVPENPDLEIRTDELTVEQTVEKVLNLINSRILLKS